MPQIKLTRLNLEKSGFSKVGEWALDEDSLTLRRRADISGEDAVYAFVRGFEILHVGVAASPLRQRLRFYAKPGPTQRTSIRVGGLIIEEIRNGSSIEVLAAWPGRTDWNGLPVYLAHAVEIGLIRAIRPPWNIRGKPKGEKIIRSKIAYRPPGHSGGADPSSYRNLPYWVYENRTRKKAIAHRAECSFCNYGRGLHGGGRSASGEWTPFSDRQIALSYARSTQQPDIRFCANCAP